MKKFHIKTYGCQMNQRDSEALACLLQERGMIPSDGEADADVLIFNTCSVRDQAERKAIGKVQILKRLKKERPEIILGIIGCMAQNHRETLFEQIPHLDFVVGTDRLHDLPDIVTDILVSRRRITATESGDEIMGELCGHKWGDVSAYVSVMRGCNQFCSYCIVPFVRGREKSRTAAEIVAEVTLLAERGTKEVMLLGQNVTAYGLAEARKAGAYTDELSPFANLLAALNTVPGLERIRFTSPHPRNMNASFIEAVTSLSKVCAAFHIPLQSGSDRILKLMKRGYTADDYCLRIAAIRARRAESVFSTDVIVGFPGETDEDFLATRQLMAAVGYDMAYIFKYSPREGTAAAELADDVPREIKEERNQILLTDLEARAEQSNRTLCGSRLEVLAEGPSKRNRERWSGRSRSNKTCIFEPPPGIRPGDLVEIVVTRTTSNSLFGRVAEETSEEET